MSFMAYKGYLHDWGFQEWSRPCRLKSDHYESKRKNKNKKNKTTQVKEGNGKLEVESLRENKRETEKLNRQIFRAQSLILYMQFVGKIGVGIHFRWTDISEDKLYHLLISEFDVQMQSDD